jgi:hypothetical protein
VFAKFRARLRPPTAYEAFAIVLAFLALGSSSYAALTITGRNVKDSSLAGRDIKNRSLTRKDIKKGSLTTTEVKDRSLVKKDFKAGQLPQGPQGLKGEAGRNSTTNVVVRTAALGMVSAEVGGTVFCKPGERAVGGGAGRSDGGGNEGTNSDGLGTSVPLIGTPSDPQIAQDGNTATGWRADFHQAPPGNGEVALYVLCASP